MTSTITPKLVVCDLDKDLLNNREAETELLDTWMTWERGHRPLLLFHSTRDIDELQHLLPSSVLPPPDFLIGGNSGMLVRHSFWNHENAENSSGPIAGFAPEHLLASMASRALTQLNASETLDAPGFPKVESAVLTMAGLSVTFASERKNRRPVGPNAPLAWLLAQLQFDTTEVRAYASAEHASVQRRKAAV